MVKDPNKDGEMALRDVTALALSLIRNIGAPKEEELLDLVSVGNIPGESGGPWRFVFRVIKLFRFEEINLS
jgi:hypothetical protein